MRSSTRALIVVVSLLALAGRELLAAEADLVSIHSVDRTIIVDLRYSGPRNIAQRPLYPANMPALVRPQVAAKLAKAQAILRENGYGLKIWDAYRPASVHDQLWQLSPNTDYLQDPSVSASLHTYGVAVDATLVDSKGREVRMPTDFDDFTMAAMLKYTGGNAEIRRNLHRLQNAMARTGFYGLRTEWWHFIARDWKEYEPIPEITIMERGGTGVVPARTETARRDLPRSSPTPSAGNPAVRRGSALR
ncbi:MAG: M15 family metallopeptidase [Chthoniobacterales bacterium]